MSVNGANGNGNGFSEVEIVHTTDEEGQVHVFEKVDEVEVDGQEYALLIYRGTEEDAAKYDDTAEDLEEEVLVMKILYEDGLEVYENIENEDEFEKVVQHIEYLQEDEDEDEEDEDDGEAIEIELSELLQHLESDEGDEPKKN